MKNVIKLITPVALMFLFAVSSNAQAADTKIAETNPSNSKLCCKKICDATNCDPKLCSTLLPQCCKEAKTSSAETPSLNSENTTRVAAAAAERTVNDLNEKPVCAATSSKKCCAKKGN